MQNIFYQDQKSLDNKVSKMTKANLVVVADFSKTFTTAFIDGEKSDSSWSQVRKQGHLGEDYKDQSEELFSMYKPIEDDDSVSEQVKVEALSQWWREHLELLVRHGMSKSIASAIVSSGKIQYRKGVKEFLQKLNDENIPLIIFSSGLGNLVEASLEHEKLFLPNIEIVSNFLEYDEDGVACGYQSQTIVHTSNKAHVDLRNTSSGRFFDEPRDVLLLGDSLDDLGMTSNIDVNEIIKIGFLNYDKEEYLDEFTKSFDVVVTDDGDFSVVNEIMEKIK